MKKIIFTLVLFLVPSIILANEINNIDMINIEVPAKVDSFFNILIPLEAR